MAGPDNFKDLFEGPDLVLRVTLVRLYLSTICFYADDAVLYVSYGFCSRCFLQKPLKAPADS